MMRRFRTIVRDLRGAAAIEFAIAVPILVSMIWGILQFALVFEANAGMAEALGQAARYATVFPTPTDADIASKITSSRFGGNGGTWGTPTITTDDAAGTKTVTVTYSQPLNFLFFNGPTVTLTKAKVIYLSS
jgi:Flp pilus assembly protein TadG